jgi:hypothetical protein
MARSCGKTDGAIVPLDHRCRNLIREGAPVLVAALLAPAVFSGGVVVPVVAEFAAADQDAKPLAGFRHRAGAGRSTARKPWVIGNPLVASEDEIGRSSRTQATWCERRLSNDHHWAHGRVKPARCGLFR